jgi:hypothetical protein
LVSLGFSAAKAGREQIHNNPMATVSSVNPAAKANFKPRIPRKRIIDSIFRAFLG